MPLPNTRIYFSPWEVNVILPGLGALVSRFSSARPGAATYGDPMSVVYFPEIAGKPFDQATAGIVVSAHNKVKDPPSSRELRLSSFELAALAFAVRVARREQLIPEPPSADLWKALEKKIETYRRRARRAAERAVGKAAYQQAAKRWRQLLRWSRYNILRIRRRHPSPSRLLQREQREQMRKLALQVVSDDVDPKMVCHWADLARREVRRGRHGMKLRELLKDPEGAAGFMGDFIMKRIDPELLKPES